MGRWNMNLNDAINKLTVSQQEVNNFYNGETYGNEFKIKSANIFIDDLIKYYSTEIHAGKTLPWTKTHDKFHVRPGEVTLVTGPSGHGKSMWLSQVILHLMKSSICLVSSLEMRPVLTMARMLAQALGSQEPTDEYVTRFCERAASKLYIYDQTGVTTSEDMIATLFWGKHVLGVEVFVIDSLMKMADIAEDNYNAQKLFADRLAVVCRDLNIHIFLVAHTRKLSDEEQIPDATDIMGSSHLRNLSDNILCCWRNRYKERLKDEGKTADADLKIIPDAKIFVQKQRNFQFEGSFNFWYDPKGLRYKESP